MAARNLFSTHFPLSHLAPAKLPILLFGMQLNTEVTPLLNQTSLISVAAAAVNGVHGGLQSCFGLLGELINAAHT